MSLAKKGFDMSNEQKNSSFDMFCEIIISEAYFNICFNSLVKYVYFLPTTIQTKLY